MTIHFAGASERRKELVAALAEITGAQSQYLGAPRFDYRVGDFIVRRDAVIDIDDLMDEKELGITLHALRGRGFIPIDSTTLPYVNAPNEKETVLYEASTHEDGVTITFPKGGLSEQVVDNLRKLIAAKGHLIRLALDVDNLPIEENDESISFSWLSSAASGEMVNVTTILLTAMIKLAKKLKRVTTTERITDNPRYALRCFLLRLGFVGTEYKEIRRCLMQGVTGDGSHARVSIKTAEPNTTSKATVEIERPEKLES